MMEETILIKLLDYGIAGVALFLLFKIANGRLREISSKLDMLAHKIDELRNEIRGARG